MFGGGRYNLHDIVAYGVQDQLAHRMNVKLPHEIGPVSFCRLHAQAQCDGDFFRALAFGKKLDDLSLTGSQASLETGCSGPPLRYVSRTISATLEVKKVLRLASASIAEMRSRPASDFNK